MGDRRDSPEVEVVGFRVQGSGFRAQGSGPGALLGVIFTRR